MKEFKGTTGEWKAVHYSPWSNKVTTADGYEIADVYDGGYNGVFSITEAEANANLIAAAPELLGALQVCWKSLYTYGRHPIIDEQVKEAINKALGL